MTLRAGFVTLWPKTRFGLACAALAAVSLPALGADLPSRRAPPVYVPPPLPVFTWTGFYVGATAGAGSERTSTTTVIYPGRHLVLPPDLNRVAAAGTIGGNRVGFIGGGEIGYNYQVNQLVFGAEADAEYLGGGALVATNGGRLVTGNPFSVTTSSRADFMTTVRGRAGFTVDRALFYATGGLALIDRQLDQSYVDTLVGPTTGRTSASSLRAGFVVGGGIEYAFTQNWSVKGEYLFVRETGSAAYTITSRIGSTNLLSVSDRRDINLGRIGLNYRFDMLAPAPVVARY
jgi:outer membrane immunogenic protein